MSVDRRNLLKTLGTAGLLGLAAPREQRAQEQAARATRGMPIPKIKDISVIECQPAGVRLTVVKITTDQDGLYGYGCATFTQRADLVKPAVERYLKPFLLGKTTDRIEDIWQACYDSSYWKNGPVLNNAISGIDQALWDIKGRQAGMPVYQLAGGKCREAADCYAHADGADYPDVVESREALHGAGLPPRARAGGRARHGRLRQPRRGGATRQGAARQAGVRAGRLPPPRAQAARRSAARNWATRSNCCTTCTSASRPIRPCSSAKDAEKFKLFFLEDPLSPEDLAYFRQIRQQCATPIAMGELFNSPHEWTPLIAERLIDYIRVHVSQAGGFTPAARSRSWRETFGVKTAWHGPGDVSPVGPHGERDAGPGQLQLRHPGILRLQDADPGDLPGLSGDEGRLPVGQRKARLGHRDGREGRRKGPVHLRPEQPERRLGRDPPRRRHRDQAIGG